MKLMMLFGNEIIDIIKIRKTKVSPSDLLHLKEELIGRNEENLNVASDEPQFAIAKPVSKRSLDTSYVFI
jgi:hypothetical protein